MAAAVRPLASFLAGLIECCVGGKCRRIWGIVEWEDPIRGEDGTGTNGDSVRTLASSNLMHWMAISTNIVPATNLFDVFDPVSLPWWFYRMAKP